MNAQERKAHLRELLRLPDDLVGMLPPLAQSDLKLARLMEQELPGILLGQNPTSSSAPETPQASSSEDKTTVCFTQRASQHPQPNQESP